MQKRNDSFRSRSSLRYIASPYLCPWRPASFYRLINEQSCSLVSETSTCRRRGLRWRADLPNVLYVVSYSDLCRIKEHLRNPASEVIKSDEPTQRIVRSTSRYTDDNRRDEHPSSLTSDVQEQLRASISAI